jgi:uncharacterized protein with NAD-binding domain and iron-sulfur cluster
MLILASERNVSSQKPIEVAVIGGGCAAITTAFELTRPEHRGKFHVTVYQVGWRLGGKGASGRGPADRIEEHGFHIWMGFYENAFRLLRECYAELNRDPRKCRMADWRDAFAPEPLIGVMDRSPRGEWFSWLALFPPAAGLPGDPLTKHNPFSIAAYLAQLATMLRITLAGAQTPRPTTGFAAGARAGTNAESANGSDESRRASRVSAQPGGSGDEIAAAIARLFKYGLLATIAGLGEAVALLEAMLWALPQYPINIIVNLLSAVASEARRQIEPLIDNDDEMRRLWEVIDLTLAVMTGIVRFGLATDPRGFDAIDDYELRDWLRLNGASERSLDSALLRGIYDLAFAYKDGDPKRPNQAAGCAMRGSLRMFLTYRGAFFWRMQAAMGDVVFAPFYEVLKRRGVTFNFFHRLTRLKLADASALAPGERAYVEALEFDVQALTRDGGEYQPLIDVRGLPCWPSQPDLSQLADGDRIREEGWDFESHWDRRKAATRTLRVGVDFDLVVLGVGLGALPEVARDLIARDQRWRDLVSHVTTVATQAFQIWMREDLAALGWHQRQTAVSAFCHPFDTCADMRHLITEESWPVRPRAIAYFCSVLSDGKLNGAPAGHSVQDLVRSNSAVADSDRVNSTALDCPGEDYGRRQREQVRRNAIDFLNRDIKHLWPGAARAGGGFRWDLLMAADESAHSATYAAPAACEAVHSKSYAAPTAGEAVADSVAPAQDAGESRFDTQFWTANVNPSDRYVQSPPKTTGYRISPLDNTYDNLTVAGDWTACGLNVGCVEAAVMSGRLAAHALAGSPALEEIVGYDHP